MANVRLAESEGGAKRIIDKIDFEYYGEDVKIFDPTLTTVLMEGKFVGTNEWGNALLQVGEETLVATQGRMRHSK